MSDYGYRIKELREEKNLTQTQLGEMVGVTGVAIMRYEKNLREPNSAMIKKLADALGVSAGYLQGYESRYEREIFDALQRKDSKAINEILGLPHDAVQIVTYSPDEVENNFSERENAYKKSLVYAYNKSMVDADTVDVGLMALLIKKNQHCTLEQAEKLAEVVAKCIQVGGDSAKAALSFDRIDDAQKPAALAMLRALERNEPKK